VQHVVGRLVTWYITDVGSILAMCPSPANTMDNKDLEKQKKLEDDTLLYFIRHVVKKWNTGTWEDTTAVYNFFATKNRSQDGLTTRYKSLEKKTFDKEIGQKKWMDMESKVKKLLQEGGPYVRRANLDEKPS
jgi:hypothetical protein